jgi:enoyl-CoA hydratase
VPLTRVEQRGDTTIVAFSRPPVNAINLELVRDFHDSLVRVAVQAPPGGVVVTGDGPAFSAGVDFKELPGYTADQKAEMIGHINAAITVLYGLDTATVAAVNGHAIGGAFVVMLACDARLVARGGAKLGLTEVTAGIPYPAGPMEVAKAEVEPGLRRHLVMSGELIGPQEAAAAGLVDEIVDPPRLLERAVELAQVRAAARSYADVKQQLRAETMSRLTAIVAGGRDPMLDRWP